MSIGNWKRRVHRFSVIEIRFEITANKSKKIFYIHIYANNLLLYIINHSKMKQGNKREQVVD